MVPVLDAFVFWYSGRYACFLSIVDQSNLYCVFYMLSCNLVCSGVFFFKYLCGTSVLMSYGVSYEYLRSLRSLFHEPRLPVKYLYRAILDQLPCMFSTFLLDSDSVDPGWFVCMYPGQYRDSYCEQLWRNAGVPGDRVSLFVRSLLRETVGNPCAKAIYSVAEAKYLQDLIPSVLQTDSSGRYATIIEYFRRHQGNYSVEYPVLLGLDRIPQQCVHLDSKHCFGFYFQDVYPAGYQVSGSLVNDLVYMLSDFVLSVQDLLVDFVENVLELDMSYSPVYRSDSLPFMLYYASSVANGDLAPRRWATYVSQYRFVPGGAEDLEPFDTLISYSQYFSFDGQWYRVTSRDSQHAELVAFVRGNFPDVVLHQLSEEYVVEPLFLADSKVYPKRVIPNVAMLPWFVYYAGAVPRSVTLLPVPYTGFVVRLGQPLTDDHLLALFVEWAVLKLIFGAYEYRGKLRDYVPGIGELWRDILSRNSALSLPPVLRIYRDCNVCTHGGL